MTAVAWWVTHRGGKAHSFEDLEAGTNALCGMTLVLEREQYPAFCLPYKYEQNRATNPGFQCKTCQSLLREKDDMSTRRKRLETQLRLVSDQLARLDEMPQDDFPLGAVVWFKKKFGRGGLDYTYAYVKYDEDTWAGTASSRNRMSWEELCDFMVGTEVWWACQWERLDA